MRFDIYPFKDVDEAKTWALAKIDEAASVARSRYVTSITGQDAIYSAKLAEAKSYVSADYPDDLNDYHWIREESTATGISAKDTANSIIAAGSMWNEVTGPMIEGLRVGGKMGVNTLTSIQDVLSHVSNIMDKLSTV